MDILLLLVPVATALSVACAAYTCRGRYVRLVGLAARDLAERLHSLHLMCPRLHVWIHIYLAAVGAAFFALWLGLDSLLVALPAAAGLLAGPWLLIRRLAQARREKIEQQLADAMSMFSTGIRAGLSLSQALELLACECPAPIRQEFEQIVAQYKLGKPLERTLAEARRRLDSENFVLFAAALQASRESGGRLNQTVQRIAQSVLELQRLERKVTSETAQARKSAVYMALVPPLILGVYYFMDPDNTRLLFVTLPGQLLLVCSVVLNLAAYVWARRILHAEL